jgi:hypothetical protein
LNTSSGLACSAEEPEVLAAHWDCQEEAWREEEEEVGVAGGLGDRGDFLGETEGGRTCGGRSWLNKDRSPAGIKGLK